MTDERHSSVEAVDRDGCGLRLTFVWHRDRYAHTIGLLAAGQLTPLFASREGSDDDLWPPSPPLQQLSIEDRDDGSRVALLVGMAGKSHWSAAIEAPADRSELIFDVACRVKGEAAVLGSAYRAMLPVDSTNDGRLACTHDGHECIATPDRALTPPTDCVQDPDGIRLLPTTDDKVDNNSTIRWKYTLAVRH